MTTQEEQMLQFLAERVNTTQLSEKDPEAEQFLQKTLGQNTNALYILAQTVLVQQYALDQAQKQLSDTRAQLDQLRQQQQQQPKPATSFLGNLLGHNNEPPAPPPPPPPYAQPQFTPVPTSALPTYGAPQYSAPQSSSFLGTAMKTAAGVAAGALAFEGIESLMHGFGHSSGSGLGFGGGGFGGFGESNRPEEIVNNYYGDASPHEHAEHTDYLSPDREEHRSESRFSDAVYNDDRGDSLNDKDDSSLTNDDLLTDSNDFDDSSDLDSGSDDTSF
ncbi:MAG TPA: DUF2076 domain-containing protein [Edaphobacter sp.]